MVVISLWFHPSGLWGPALGYLLLLTYYLMGPSFLVRAIFSFILLLFWLFIYSIWSIILGFLSYFDLVYSSHIFIIFILWISSVNQWCLLSTRGFGTHTTLLVLIRVWKQGELIEPKLTFFISSIFLSLFVFETDVYLTIMVHFWITSSCTDTNWSWDIVVSLIYLHYYHYSLINCL